MRFRRVRGFTLATVLAAGVGLGCASVAAAASAGNYRATRTHHGLARHARPLVRTDKGLVVGLVKNRVNEFLGIPYAAPPVGMLRWRPPHQHARWHRPLDATAFGPTCPNT